MKRAPRSLLKRVVPPGLRRWWRRRFGWRWFEGDYARWADARAAAAGYDDARTLERSVAAARAVRAGRARWERDGDLFYEPEAHAPLLAALRAAAMKNGGRLDVVDIGGALGSTWWQHRAWLGDLRVRWRIVEQPALVAAGRAEFADAPLDFFETLDEPCADTSQRPGVALLSSVLPYVEQPHGLLADVIARGFADIIIDRTGFGRGGRDRLVVQRTPPRHGGGSYPCWQFDRARLLAPLAADYRLAAEWPGFDDLATDVDYRGLHFVRRTAPPT